MPIFVKEFYTVKKFYSFSQFTAHKIGGMALAFEVFERRQVLKEICLWVKFFISLLYYIPKNLIESIYTNLKERNFWHATISSIWLFLFVCLLHLPFEPKTRKECHYGEAKKTEEGILIPKICKIVVARD